MPTAMGLHGDAAQPLSSLQSKCPRQRCWQGEGAGQGHPGVQGGGGTAALTCLRESRGAAVDSRNLSVTLGLHSWLGGTLDEEGKQG